MIDRAWRALLLAVTILLVGGRPSLAQSGDAGPLESDDGSVLVGIRNDVALACRRPPPMRSSWCRATPTSPGRRKGLVAIDSDVTVPSGGSVEGIFIVGGTLAIEDGASVKDVAYVDTGGDRRRARHGRAARRQDGLRRGGRVGRDRRSRVILFFVFIGWLIAVLVSALLLVAFGTSQARRAAANIGGDTLKTIVAGLIMLILPWIVIGLLFVTVVGIPLAIGLAVLWGFTAFLGWLVAGLWLGQLILRAAAPRPAPTAPPSWACSSSCSSASSRSWGAIMSLLGLGAVTLAGWRVLRAGGTPPAPIGYGGPWGQPYQVPPPPYAPPPYAPPPPPRATGRRSREDLPPAGLRARQGLAAGPSRRATVAAGRRPPRWPCASAEPAPSCPGRRR